MRWIEPRAGLILWPIRIPCLNLSLVESHLSPGHEEGMRSSDKDNYLWGGPSSSSIDACQPLTKVDRCSCMPFPSQGIEMPWRVRAGLRRPGVESRLCLPLPGCVASDKPLTSQSLPYLICKLNLSPRLVSLTCPGRIR